MSEVLVIEDNPNNVRLVRRALGATHQLVICETAQVALTCEARPDLILVDLELPDLHGYQLVALLAERFPGVRLVAHSATSAATSEALAQALALGCDGYLPKPIRDLAAFRASITHYLDGSHARLPQMDNGYMTTTLRQLVRDLVGKTQALEALLARQDALLAGQQMFARAVTHELRTPLMVLKGYVEAWRSGLLLPESGEDPSLLDVETSVERLLRHSTDLTLLLQVEQGRFTVEKTRCDTHALLEQVARRWRQVAPQAQIMVRGTEEPGWVWADPVRLEQILDNLISNALRASPPSQARVALSLAHEAEVVHLQVQDWGKGIPADKQHLIFQPFTQIESSYYAQEGLGLGLTLTRALVEAHGGTLQLSSVFGQGTTLTVTLPAIP